MANIETIIYQNNIQGVWGTTETRQLIPLVTGVMGYCVMIYHRFQLEPVGTSFPISVDANYTDNPNPESMELARAPHLGTDSRAIGVALASNQCKEENRPWLVLCQRREVYQLSMLAKGFRSMSWKTRAGIRIFL